MKRKIAIISCGVLAAAALGTAVACTSDPGYEFKDYTYENPSQEVSVPGVTLDGKFEESFWQEVTWHETSDVWNTNTWAPVSGVRMRMSAYLGEEGITFGVQVFDDSFTYYRVGRTFYGNSGIEVFLSTEPDLANEHGGGWEIMVDCVGNHLANRWEVNQFLGNNYVAFPLEVYSAAFVDGEVNGEATSMGAEVYIPYASLGIEKPDMVYANYAYNRNRDSNNSRDDFCCVGMSEMGASWSDAYKWYQVDESGVKIAKREGVVLEGEGDIGFSVYSGEVSTSVTPAEGYYLTALSVNGVPANENYLTIRNDGSVSYTITDATQDVKVEAKFAQYPAAKMAGTVTLTGVEGEASLYAENGMSRTLVATFDASEPYSYSLPALATRLVAEADGYYDAAASVTEAGGDVSLSTERIAFGKNENIPEGYRGDLSQWDFGAYKTDGVIRSLTTGNYVRASYNNAYSTNVFLSSNIVMAQGVTDRRVGYSFTDADGDSYFITILYQQSDGKYYVQGVSRDGSAGGYEIWEYKKELSAEYSALLTSDEGLPFAVRYQDGMFTIWVNDMLFDESVVCHKSDWSTNAFGTGVSVAPGLETWGYRGLYKNAVFEMQKVEANVPASTEHGAVTAQDTTYGGILEIRLTPDEGFGTSWLTINGIDLYSYDGYSIEVDGDTVVVSFPEWRNLRADIDAAFGELAEEKVSFKVELYDYFAENSKPLAAGTVVTLTGLRGQKEYTIEGTTDNKGNVDFGSVPCGTYVLSVGGDFETFEVEVGGDMLDTYVFTAPLIVTNNQSVDLSKETEGTISYNANWCDEVILRDIGGGEDFMISTIVSPFTLIANAPGEPQVGFYAVIGAGDKTGDNGNEVNQVRGGVQIKDGKIVLQYKDGWWESYTLPEAYQAAFAAGTLRIGYGRSQGVFFLAAGIDNGTDPCTMTRFVNLVGLTSDITRNAIDALHLYNNGTEQVTLKNILFTRTDLPELGRITFNGEENSEMPIGRTDTENYSVAANEDFFISGRIEGKLLNTSQKDEGERWLGFSVWQAGIWEGWWGTKYDTSGAHGGFKDDGKGNVGLQWAGQGDGTWPWVDVYVTREDLENGEVWFGFGRIDNRLFLCAWKEGGAKVFNVIPGYDSQMTKLAGALTIGKYAPGTRGTLLDASFVTGSDVPEDLMAVTTSVAPSENGKAEIVTQNVALGGELKIVVTPKEDYRLDSLTVNGKDYKAYSGVQTQREGEKVTVTFPSWIANKAEIAAVFEKVDYIEPSGTTAENGTVTVSDRIPVGDDLVIRLAPDDGYMFSSLTINDKDYSEYEDIKLVYDGENVTVTIPAWAEKNAAISAAFVQIQKTEVTFKVTVSDPFALQQPNLADVDVYLVSERTGAETKVNPAADGTVNFGQLVNGTYTLRIDGAGYPAYTVEVGGTPQASYAFVRQLVATGDGVALDETEVTISQDNRDAQIAYEVAADSDFMLTAGVSEFAANSANDAIVGLYAMTGAGDEVGNTGGTVNKVMGGIYLKADGVYLQFVGTEQSGVRLPEAYQEAFKAGTLRIALGRAQSVWFLAAAVGEGEFTRFVDAARVTSSLISMGGFTLGLYNSGTAQVSLTLGLKKEDVPVKGILVYDETGHDEIAYGRTQAANWNVSAGEDFYISARLAGELTNADGSGTERKLGFAVWEKDKWEGWWATDPDTSGVRGGIKVNDKGIAGLEWSGDNNWSWPWVDLPEGGQDAYENGTLLFGFGRIDGNFFICAGTSEENMAFNILQTAWNESKGEAGKLFTRNLVIGKWCNTTNVRGALADVMFYVGDEVASVVTLPQG